MLTYCPKRFTELNDFENARDILPARKKFLSEIGILICQHRMQKTVGVCLLHKHFELGECERLVKDVVPDAATLLPTEITDDLELIPYMWKFEKEDGDYRPLEFLRKTASLTKTHEASVRVQQSKSFLDEAGQRLRDLGLQDIFGLCLVHAEPLEEGSIWLEETNSRQRTIRLSVGPDHGIAGITETNWTFEIDEAGLCDDCLREFGISMASDELNVEEPLGEPQEQPSKEKPWKNKPWKKDKPGKPEKALPEPKPGVNCTVHCHRHCHNHCHVHCHTHCHQHCPPHRPTVAPAEGGQV